MRGQDAFRTGVSQDRGMKNSALALTLILFTLPTGCSQGEHDAYVPATPQTQHATMQRAAGTRARYVYVAGYDAKTPSGGGDSELAVFAASANGNAAPLNVIRGSKTELYSPQSAVVDATGRLWTCDFNGSYVLAFPAKKFGNIAPSVKIAGSNSPLQSCGGMTLDSSGAIYASSFDTALVAKWPAGSNGNVAPSDVWSGNLTGLYVPAGIAIGTGGDLFIGNSGKAAVSVFGPNAGNVAPLRSIAGSHTRMNDGYNVAIDPTTQRLFVADENNNTVQIFAAGANGNATPVAWLSGKNTQIDYPYGIAVDDAGYIYVGNCPQTGTYPQGAILVFAPGAHGDVKPIQTIAGSKTDLDCVNDLTVK